MNIFLWIGLALLIASEAYMPWKDYWQRMRKTPAGIFSEYRAGTAPHRPQWSRALSVLGLGLCVLGFYRLWFG